MAAEAHDDAASLRERPVQEPGVSGPEAPVRNRKRRDALRDRSRQKHARRGISEAEDIGARSPACRALRTRAMASAKKKPGKPGFFSRSAPLLEWLDVDRLRTFGAAGALERHLLVFLQALDAAALDRREVREKILPAVIRSDEPETLGVVEPLYRACTHVTGLPKK